MQNVLSAVVFVMPCVFEVFHQIEPLSTLYMEVSATSYCLRVFTGWIITDNN